MRLEALVTSGLPPRPLVIVPGYQDSGPEHWQTLWEQSTLKAIRFAPKSFEHPELDDWVDSILGAVELAAGAFGEKPVIVAHSLGCLAAIACSLKYPPLDLAGMFLVAMPDPRTPAVVQNCPTFVDIDQTFRVTQHSATVIASVNDPFDPQVKAAQIARTIGATLHNVGPLGHVNAESGLGHWEQGQRMLADFVAPLPR